MPATPYLPPLLPLTISEDAWGSFGMLEFNAVSSLAELNGMMRSSAKADLFWLTWLLQEARSSNVIEGTVTTFEEILGENAGVVVPAERQQASLSRPSARVSRSMRQNWRHSSG